MEIEMKRSWKLILKMEILNTISSYHSEWQFYIGLAQVPSNTSSKYQNRILWNHKNHTLELSC